ncbi:MAG: SLC13 family permease [Actinomycetota bacterium]|nr:SLC13 family permease [Actinomycetota bacterium]
MLSVLRDVVPALALAALLVIAYLHLPQWVEAVAGVLAPAMALSTGALGRAGVRRELGHLQPVVVFLSAILVVSEACRAAGVFAAIGQRLALLGRPQLILALTFVVATATTVALSLDATVVLLTPVVVVAAASAGVAGRPGELACVRLANSASLLLPVSNLTNLLALPSLGLSFSRFALLMSPVWLVVVLVEYAASRWWFRRDLRRPPGQIDPDRSVHPEPDPLPAFPLTVVGLMLVGFAVTSPLGIAPAWVAVVAATVLVLSLIKTRQLTLTQAANSANVPFAIFVLGLGIVVAVLSRTWLGDLVAQLVPTYDGLGALLVLAVLGAVLANLLNNLPATLLIVPLVAPLGALPALAALVGINIGSSMTWTGSLANLLWRRTLRAAGVTPPSRDFHLLGLLASPVAIVLGVAVLHAWAGIVS